MNPYLPKLSTPHNGLPSRRRNLAPSAPIIGSGLPGLPRRAAAAAVEEAVYAEAVDFDGAADYLSRTSDLIGNADSKTFTFSAWFMWSPLSGQYPRIYSWGTDSSNYGHIALPDTISDTMGIQARSGNVITFDGNLSIGQSFKNTFMHILISINMDSQSNSRVFINDIDSNMAWGTFNVGQNIDFTQSSHRVANDSYNPNPSFYITGRLAHVFLDHTFRDLSIEANRRLFITSDRKPTPKTTLSALTPILYLPMDDPTTAHINSGTGGNFTLNGTIARSGRGPNQFNATYSDLDGVADYVSAAAITGIADGKQFTMALDFNPDYIGATQIITFGSGSSYRFMVSVDNPGIFSIIATTSAGSIVLNASSNSAVFVIGRNYRVTVSIDLTSTALRHVYVNGESITMTWNTYTNSAIGFNITSTPRYRVGCNVDAAPANFVNGRLGNILFHTGYIDLSIPSNLSKFVTGTGIDAKPAELGANGELPLGVQPLIYLPMYGNNAGKNYGSGGDFTVNSGPFTGARGPNEFRGNRATFNGTASVISKTAQLSGIADSKVFLLSFFIKKTGSVLYTICDTTGAAVRVTIDASNRLVIVAENSAGTVILSATVTTTITNTTDTHVIMSIDLANASNRAIYLNNVSASVTWTTYTNDLIDFTVTDFYIGSEVGGGNKFAGDLSEFFLTTPTSYVDITQEPVRLKFRDAFGYCVDLGSNGSTPLGTQPVVYLRFDPSAFGVNAGSGGNFTASNINDGGQL